MKIKFCQLINFISTLVLFNASALIAEEAVLKDTQLTVPIHRVSSEGIHELLGNITLIDSSQGLILIPELKGVPAGERGFHVHELGSCLPKEIDGKVVPAGSAGPHFDPHASHSHAGPEGDGHLGDLPFLEVAQDGTANGKMLAKRLTIDLVKGRSLMIHAGGDNYADQPEPLGGGGPRFACGVIGAQ